MPRLAPKSFITPGADQRWNVAEPACSTGSGLSAMRRCARRADHAEGHSQKIERVSFTKYVPHSAAVRPRCELQTPELTELPG